MGWIGSLNSQVDPANKRLQEYRPDKVADVRFFRIQLCVLALSVLTRWKNKAFISA